MDRRRGYGNKYIRGASAHVGKLDCGLYREGEEGAILDCFQACFGKERNIETWRHLHFDNPSGKAIIVMARDQGVVVSCCALIPRRIKAFGHYGLAGHSVWAMTRPEWQRRGLHTTLAIEAREIARQRDYQVIYGFANNQSLHGILKYQGRRPVRPFPVMIRPVRTARAVLGLLRSKFPGTSETDVLSFEYAGWDKPLFDDRHTELFRQIDSMPSIAVIRDSPYLTWRYSPTVASAYLQRDAVTKSDLEATVVTRMAAQFGLRLVFVMDWFWKRQSRWIGLQLMRETVKLARCTGASGVMALAMPGTLQRRMLHRLGFIGIPEAFLPEPITLTVGHLADLVSTPLWFKSPNWYLTFSDGDQV